MTSPFERALALCHEHLAAAREQAAALGLADDFAPVLADVRRTEFRVSVLGRFKQGKSTVLNAMLGAELLPTDALPCTSTLIEVHRAEEPYFAERRGTTETRRTRGEFTSAVGGAAEKRGAQGAGWRVGVVSDALPDGLVLVDTPGTDEDEERHAAAVSELRRTDAAIFVLSARQAAGLGEVSDLRELCERIPIVIVLVNQMDLLPTPQRERVLQFIRGRLCEAGVAPERVLPFSGLGALRGDRDAQAWLSDARRLLSDVLTHNTAGSRLLALQSTLACFFEQLDPRIDAAVNVREEASVAAARTHDSAAQSARQLAAQLTLIETTCERIGTRTARAAADALETVWPVVLALLHRRRTRWVADASPVFSPLRFAEEVASCARADLLLLVEPAVSQSVQPVISRGLEQTRSAIEPDVPELLSLMGRVSPGMSADQHLFDEMFRDALGAILAAVEGGANAARKDAATAAITASVGRAITQVVASLVAMYAMGLVALPILIAAVVGAAAVSAFMGRDWLVTRARDQIANIMVEKLGDSDVVARIAASVRRSTRDVFIGLGKAIRRSVRAKLDAAEGEARQQATHASARQADLLAAVTAAKAAREALRSVQRTLDAERERLAQARQLAASDTSTTT